MQSFKNIGKTILVKANKGGVGKSWITLQLAHKAAIDGNKVIIITSDSQNNILDFSGCGSLTPLGLDEWLTGGNGGFTELRKNLYYIPFNSAMLPEELEVRFESFVNVLKEEFDYIFIDSTPVLNLDRKFIELADEVVIPTFLDNVTIGSIVTLMEQIEPRNKVKAIIPNRVGRNKIEKEYYKNLKDIVSQSIFLSVPIKQSSFISRAIDNGKTIWEYNAKEAKALQELFLQVLEVL
ncbi:ParA family protein [Fusobacterium mortiferum]|uniref:ParA family protein n=1 Tax=Fusobacterium mortiferum TaxID=850 RepID=A0ABS2G1B1_FUSMR|nr:ParA family protein [Fusobacterium mortiferum]MBM6874422.1 ParA family protein [Fusobacterium mortiferum]